MSGRCGFVHGTLGALLLIALAAEARATESAAGVSPSVPAWRARAGTFGTRGVYRVEAGTSLSPGELVVSIGGEVSRASDFLVQGDVNQRLTQRLGLAWSPLGYVDVFFNQSTVSNKNGAFQPEEVVTLGDPLLGLKGSYDVGAGLGVGLLLTWLVPTSANGGGLAIDASVVSIVAAASYAALPWLSLAFNAGYVIDGTDAIFGDRALTPAQRFAGRISGENAVRLGLGATTSFDLIGSLQVGPFLEVSTDWATAQPFSDSPTLLTGGAVLSAFDEHLALMLGLDGRLAGAPRASGALPGVPPWELFARLVVRVDTSSARGSEGCLEDAKCGDGGTCVDGTCTVVKEVVREVAKVELETRTPETFVIEGTVSDATNSSVPGAQVAIDSVASPLAVDYSSGRFRSWPLEVSDGLMKVTATAPGYRPVEQTLSRSVAGGMARVSIVLVPIEGPLVGKIKVNLKNARTGQNVRGKLFFPQLGLELSTDRQGRLESEVKAGRFTVIISARRFVSQTKEIEIRGGDVLIFNVDMQPARR